MTTIEATKLTNAPDPANKLCFMLSVKNDEMEEIILAYFQFKRHLMNVLKQLEKEFKTKYIWKD